MSYCPVCGDEFDRGGKCPVDGAVLVVEGDAVDPLIGVVFKDSFRVDARLGEGGMCVVYRGTQTPLGRAVAIKVLRRELGSSPELIKRFLHEVKVSSRLNHPNVVQVIDGGNTEDGLCYLVMELMSGSTLHDAVPKDEGLRRERTADVFLQVCSGVMEAHRYDLIHRDLKPQNIFVVEHDADEVTVKVLDFGIAREVGDGRTSLTQRGQSVGTPGYMAPEQITGASPPDARTDVYALGAVLYFIATGRQAYSGDTLSSIVAQQLCQPPNDPEFERLALACGIREIVLKAMSSEPADRYQSVAELRSAVARWAGRDSRTSFHFVGRKIRAERAATAEAALPIGPRLSGAGRRRRGILIAAGLGGLAVAAGGIAVVTTYGGESSAEPIRLGISAAFSGEAQALGRSMRTGLLTGFREANARGGIHGRPIELVALDDGYDPARAEANMRTLIDDKHVFAVIGNVGTPTAKVTVPIANERRVPFVGAMTGAALLRKQPPDRYVFNFRASYAEEIAAVMNYLTKVRGFDPGSVAVFAQSDAFGDAVVEPLRKYTREGGELLRVGYERNHLDVGPAVEQIAARADEVKAVVIVGTYGPAAHFIKSLRERGVTPVFAAVSFVGSQALAERLESLGGETMEGVIVTQVVPPPTSDSTAVLRYRELLERYSPEEQPGFHSLEGYLVSQLVIYALELCPTPLTREGFVDAIESIREYDLGIGTEISFSTLDHQASHEVWGTVLSSDGTYRELDLD